MEPVKAEFSGERDRAQTWCASQLYRGHRKWGQMRPKMIAIFHFRRAIKMSALGHKQTFFDCRANVRFRV